MDNPHDLIVVGGGVSGLTAALVAARQGVKVTILEANDRPGGKVMTVPFPISSSSCTGTFIDLGAELVDTTQHKCVMNELSRYSINTVELVESEHYYLEDKQHYTGYQYEKILRHDANFLQAMVTINNDIKHIDKNTCFYQPQLIDRDISYETYVKDVLLVQKGIVYEFFMLQAFLLTGTTHEQLSAIQFLLVISQYGSAELSFSRSSLVRIDSNSICNSSKRNLFESRRRSSSLGTLRKLSSFSRASISDNSRGRASDDATMNASSMNVLVYRMLEEFVSLGGVIQYGCLTISVKLTPQKLNDYTNGYTHNVNNSSNFISMEKEKPHYDYHDYSHPNALIEIKLIDKRVFLARGVIMATPLKSLLSIKFHPPIAAEIAKAAGSCDIGDYYKGYVYGKYVSTRIDRIFSPSYQLKDTRIMYKNISLTSSDSNTENNNGLTMLNSCLRKSSIDYDNDENNSISSFLDRGSITNKQSTKSVKFEESPLGSPINNTQGNIVEDNSGACAERLCIVSASGRREELRERILHSLKYCYPSIAYLPANDLVNTTENERSMSFPLFNQNCSYNIINSEVYENDTNVEIKRSSKIDYYEIKKTEPIGIVSNIPNATSYSVLSSSTVQITKTKSKSEVKSPKVNGKIKSAVKYRTIFHDFSKDPNARSSWFALKAGTAKIHYDACIAARHPWLNYNMDYNTYFNSSSTENKGNHICDDSDDLQNGRKGLMIIGSDLSLHWPGWLEGAISTATTAANKMVVFLNPSKIERNYMRRKKAK